MSFSFHPEAKQELNEAIEYYENIDPGLGRDFALEIYSAIERAVDFPKTWTVMESEVRRSLVRRFPYGVLYFEENDGIFVVAVMNLHRKPDFWKYRRLKSGQKMKTDG